MRKARLGLLLLVAFIVSVVAFLQDFRFDASTRSEHDARIAIEHGLGAAETALADLQAAEVAYLAEGQSPDFWMRRANDIAADLQNRLATLKGSVKTGEGRQHLEAAETALADFYAADRRARDHVVARERLLASDVIFGDGLDASQRLASAIAAVRPPEQAQALEAAARVTRWRLGLTALALFVALAVAVYAGRSAAPAPPAPTVAAMLRDLPPPVKPAPVPVARPAAPAPPPAYAKLPEAAELCVDLARVLDSRDIPGLLERAARVLDARGCIVWIGDPGGEMLRPALTHGYPEKVVLRLGVLETAADNVTSLAFRTLRPQTISGPPGSAGAIAVPIVTASGCTGVLSAETRDSKPAPEMIALARIVAAQFATMVAPAGLSQSQVAEA